MATKKRSAGGAAVSFILCSVLSVAAGIASAVLLFQKWVTVELLGVSYSIAEFRKMVLALENTLSEVQESISALGIEMELFDLTGFERFDLVTLGVLVAIGALVLLQVVYVLLVVLGKRGSRPMGVFVGLLTTLFAVAVLGLLFWMNTAINGSLTELNSIFQTWTGASLFDANKVFQLTIFLYIVGALGLVEAFFAR